MVSDRLRTAILAGAGLSALLHSAAAGAALEAPPTRTVNFRVQPLGLLFGVYGAEADLAILPSLSIGPGLAWFSAPSDTGNYSLLQYGASLSGYLEGFASARTPFARLAAYGYSIQTQTASATLEYRDFSTGLTVGYRWLWPSGVNFHLGAGAAYISSRSNTLGDTSRKTSIQPVWDASFGWAF